MHGFKRTPDEHMTQGAKSSADDPWGRDPSIQSMRRAFAEMEQAQTELLKTLRISPLDQRLRLWRQNALRLFEQQWSHSTRRGNRFGERQIADLYCACFTGILAKAGIPASPVLTPADQEMR